MKPLKDQPAWLPLARHRRVLAELSLRELFERDPHRFERFSLELDGLLLDYSKNRVTGETLDLLVRLAEQCGLTERREALFEGGIVNPTESRPALHTALRAPKGAEVAVGDANAVATVHDALERMGRLAEDVRAGRYTGVGGQPIADVINIGIGGSDLGPRLAVEALAPWADGPRVHFVANVDGTELAAVLRDAEPERTLFVVVSKSFATAETMANAGQAMAWFRDRCDHPDGLRRHFIAVTAATDRVVELGLDPDLALPMWDWVGGRYSLWSAVGFAIAVAIGVDRFREMLAGAHAMDSHFRTAQAEENIPVILALLSVWYVNFFGLHAHAVVPYTERLQRLAPYLQQLAMESNGKSVTRDGEPAAWPTAPVVWGLTGTPAQHAVFQALHQGTEVVPVDFIGVAGPVAEGAGDPAQSLANLFAQSQALMRGRSVDDLRAAMAAAGESEARIAALVPHRVCPGGRPNNVILLRDLTPRRLGMLLAMYEHKTFVEGVIWGVDTFDQWGVELGKVLADDILPALRDSELPEDADSSTRGLVARYHRWR